MDTIIEKYNELLSVKKELTEKQYLNKKRLLHVQIIYNTGNLLKALYTKEDCSILANNLLNQLINNCVLDECIPTSMEDWQTEPLNTYEKGLEYMYLVDYLEQYLTVQVVRKEPYHFKVLCNKYLNIQL
jgi:hypothetical protein